LLVPNAERYLKSPQEMEQLFADLPEAVTATRELADRLTYSMANLGYRFPDYPLPAGESKNSYLRALTYDGAANRFGDSSAIRRARRSTRTGTHRQARSRRLLPDRVGHHPLLPPQDILVQGRGSAANSAVCYSLGITAIDRWRWSCCSSGF